MVKINEIKETTCTLIDPKGNKIGIIKSCLELNDVRIQIKNQKLIGYTILWFDESSNQENLMFIDEFGYLDEWPNGFFDEWDKQLDELLGL